MNTVLAGVNAVPGVVGSCVFDREDRCVAQLLPPPYEPILLRALMQEVRASLSVLAYLEGADRWNELILSCDGGLVSFRSVGPYTLMVLAGTELNVAMLGVGASVAALKLEQLVGKTHEPAATAAAASPGSPPPPRGELLAKPILEGVIVALARQIGPIARLFVEEEAVRVAASELTAAAKFRELVVAVSHHIADPHKRREFITEAEDASRRK